jgi:hypothetical protein
MPYLVGGIPTPLKNMSSSVGMMKLLTEWKVIKAMFQTTNQLQCQKRPETYGSGSKTPTFSDSVKLKAWANASQVVWANASQIRALSSTEVGLYPSILTTNRVDV